VTDVYILLGWLNTHSFKYQVLVHSAKLLIGMILTKECPPYILQLFWVFIFCHLINDIFQEMAKILKHPRVYSFLHVPVQSASDSVLMDMRREYCQEDFKQVADFLKER